jgi:hypothetical protein
VRQSLEAAPPDLPAVAARWAELRIKADALIPDAQVQAAFAQAAAWTRQRLTPESRSALDQKMRRMAEALAVAPGTEAAAAVPAAAPDPASFARRAARLAKPSAAFERLDLDIAVKASGLQDRIAEIKEHSAGVMTIYELLAMKPSLSRGYILGLSKNEAAHKDTYQLIGDLINFTTWEPAYRGFFGRQYPPMELFMQAVTQSGQPIVMLVPQDYNNHPQAKHTSAEIDWFLADPQARMKNVYFVFGGYDMLSESRYRSDFGALPPTERKQALAAALSEHIKSAR